MQRRRTHVGDVFNAGYEGPSTSSSQSDLQSSGSRHQLTDPTTNYSINDRSYSYDNEMNYDESGNGNGRYKKWAQTVSGGGNQARQASLRFQRTMPSRMKRAFSIDGYLISPAIDHEVEEITQEIEQNEHLMDPLAEQLRIETVKALPQALRIKREIRTKITQSVTRHSSSKSISRWKRFKYRIITFSTKIKNAIKSTLTNIELWYQSMKEIEGHFGSGVGTYFKFLRWLFIANLLLLITTFSFITIPQILFNNLNATTSTRIEVMSPTINDTGSKSEALRSEHDFSVIDILTAEGFFTSSVLFYGAYTNLSFSLTPPNHYYNLPFAYFMTMICLYVVTFIVVSVSMARSYRRSFIETSGVQTMYAHKIFCSWDFGISNERAASLKHSSIYNDLKELLNELNQNIEKPSFSRRFWDISAKMCAHLIVFLMLGGLGVGMWTLLQNYGNAVELSAWTALYLSIVVNITMLILQIFFGWIAIMEDYKSPRMKLHITLFRNFLLEIVIIGVLLIFWLTGSASHCWETSVGQEIYRLVIIDFIVSILGTALIQGCRVLIYKHLWPKIGLPEFDISRASLGIIFNQTLLWVGLLFSPLLAVVVVIKMAVTFYIKKLTLINFCKAPSKLWRAAQTQTLYLVMTFLSLLGVVVTHGYIITQVNVSTECGPFRGYTYMFEIFVNGMLELKEESTFWRIVIAITRPAVMGGLLLTMGVIVYYLRAKSKARIAMVKLLQEMLYMDAQDKEFLLTNIAKITQGKEWLLEESNFNENGFRDQYAESCSTWQYRPKMGANPNQPEYSRSSNENRTSSTVSYHNLNDGPSTSGL